MDQQHGVRTRVNVSRSTKGVYSYDATVELTVGFENLWNADSIRDSLLRHSDTIVADLEARYPNGTRAAALTEQLQASITAQEEDTDA